MPFKSLFSTGRGFAVFLGKILIMLFCFSYIEYVYYTDIHPDEIVAKSFLVTNCKILEKKLSTHQTVITLYRSDFLVEYTINGKAYSSWTSGNGLDHLFTSDKTEQEELLTAFNTDALYPCYYNPKNHAQIVLVMRHDWTSTLLLLIPCLILLIVGFSLARSILSITNRS